MLRLMLKIRYGRNAKTIDRFMEFIAAVYFLILATAAPPLVTVVAAIFMMTIFCYAMGKQTWRVFAVPPLAVKRNHLAKSLFISSLISVPMVAGAIISVTQLNIFIALAMVIASAVVCWGFTHVDYARKTPPARLIHRPLPAAKTKLGHYVFFSWQRRRARWLRRIIMPYIFYPLMGIVLVQLLAFRSTDQLSIMVIPTGIALGLTCNLIYLHTDDEPGNFLSQLTEVAFFFRILPLGGAIISFALLGQLSRHTIALCVAAVCALGLAHTKSIISDHSAPVHITATVAQPTIISDVMGILLVFAGYAGAYVVVTLV